MSNYTNGASDSLVETEGHRMLREYMTRRRLTHQEFADQIGISAGALGRWLASLNTPRIIYRQAIERVTRIPVSAWGAQAPDTAAEEDSESNKDDLRRGIRPR